MLATGVSEDEDRGGQGDDGGGGEEEKVITQLHNTVLLYSAACHVYLHAETDSNGSYH